MRPDDRPSALSRPTSLRRSLRASTAEGISAELVNASAGPTILVGWALHLGASPVEAGIVGALPQLSQVVRLVLWLAAAPGRLWPIAIDAVVGGVAWGGHGLASFAAPLAVAPRRERSFYIAAFSTAAGLSYVLAVAAAGPLAGAQRSGDAPVGLDLVFALSAAGRLAAAFLALRVDERGAASLGELRRAAAGGLACAVARVHGRARASILAALRARAK